MFNRPLHIIRRLTLAFALTSAAVVTMTPVDSTAKGAKSCDRFVLKGGLDKKTDDHQTPLTKPRVRETSYWSQLAMSDAVSMGLLMTSFNTPEFVGVGALTFLLGAPIIHGFNGNFGRSFASLGIRVGLPILGFALGAEIDSCSGFLCVPTGALLGAGAGLVTALYIDYTVLAKKTETVSGQPALFKYGRFAANPGLGMTPKGGLSLGLNGQF